MSNIMVDAVVVKEDVSDTDARPIYVTFFPDEFARTLEARAMTLLSLRDLVLSTSAATKADLRLLKLARFGTEPSKNNCLRYNDNVCAIFGVAVDYDAEVIPFAEAVGRIRAARLRALIYTSPSTHFS